MSNIRKYQNTTVTFTRQRTNSNSSGQRYLLANIIVGAKCTLKTKYARWRLLS